MVVTKELIPKSEQVIAKRVEGQPKEQAQNAIIEFFKKLINHGDLQKSAKALEKLEKKARWTEEDLKIIDGLKGRISKRKGEIESEVDKIFEAADAGNIADAKKNARKLLKEHGEDVAFARNASERAKLQAFVDRTVDLYHNIDASTGRVLGPAEAEGYAEIVTTANELWAGGGITDSVFHKRVDDLEAKAVGKAIKVTFQDRWDDNDRRAEYLKKKGTRLKDVENSRTSPDPADPRIRHPDGIGIEADDLIAKARRLGINEATINRKFGRNTKDGKKWKEIDRKMAQWDSLTPNENAQALRDLRKWIRKAERDIEELQEGAIFEGVQKRILKKSPRRKSALKRGTTIVEKLGGTTRSRVLAALEYIDTDNPNSANDVLLLLETLVPGATPGSHPAEFILAQRIFSNARRWKDEHGEFQVAIHNTRRDVETKMLNLETGAFQEIGIEIDPKVTMTDAQWDKIHGLVMPGVEKDGRPVYTAEGARKMDWVRAHYSDTEKVMINGKEETMFVDNSFMADMTRKDRNGELYDRDSMQFRGMYAQKYEAEYQKLIQKGFPDHDAVRRAQDGIHDRIEELVYNIMRTQDGSREVVNQNSSLELFELFGSRLVDGDFRDLWQARMGLYDVSVFAGGAEGYEDWARIASFMPKEFLWKLFDDDELKGIIEYKDAGVPKSVDISLKDVLSHLEEKVPGSNRSTRDIWMAEILGSSDMSQIDMNKRRFFVFTLGKKMGVEFEMAGNDFKVKAGFEDKAKMKLKDGSEISIMNLVGLNENGKKMSLDDFVRMNTNFGVGGAPDVIDMVKARSQWANFEKHDKWAQYGWYVNNALMFNHMTLNSVELEKGGGAKGMWKYMPNILRKMHGEAMHHYFHQKNMGMVFARDQVDTYWRGFLPWILRKDMLTGDESVEGDLKFAAKQGGAKWKRSERKGLGGNLEEMGFDRFYYEVAYANDLWENEGVNGSLRSVEDVRYFASAEGLRTDEYRRILGRWKNFDAAGTFNWAPLLKTMGVDLTAIGLGGGAPISGENGLRLFLKYYDKYKLMNFKGVQHGSWKDFIKYTGKSNEGFNNFIPLIEHPASDEAAAKQARHLEGFMGQEGKELFATKFVNWSMRKRRSSWSYQTKVDREGKERSEKWDVYERDRNGNKLTTRSASEIRRAERLGLVVNPVDGMVYDKKGNIQYRTDERGWWKDYRLFRPAGWGSPMMARGLPQETWTEQKSILKKYLRNRTWSPDRYARENMRFQARLFFGSNIDELPDNMLDATGKAMKDLILHPWRIPLLIYTIPRGILVNLGIDSEMVMDFFSPAGKSIQKLFAS